MSLAVFVPTLECFASVVPEATSDDPAVSKEEVQDILKHSVPLDNTTGWLDCYRGTDISEIMKDDAILD